MRLAISLDLLGSLIFSFILLIGISLIEGRLDSVLKVSKETPIYDRGVIEPYNKPILLSKIDE